MTRADYLNKLLTGLLTPASWLYGFAVYLRNKLFDKHLIRQVEFDIPVICVGNLTVGGTGKTPHVEYLLNNLASRYNIGVISRGYKRRTKGYVLANAKSTPDTIGDEPCLFYQKFSRIVKVAVCENRVEGVKRLLKDFPDINLVILDDAYQHRYIKPKVSILLTDFYHPIANDHLLPLGTLREGIRGVNRADFVVVTKCPEEMKPIDYRLLVKGMDLMSYQTPYFSRYVYRDIKPVFPDDAPYRASLDELTGDDAVLLITGIANPRQFVLHFKSFSFLKRVAHYPDHHDFSRKDVEEIARRFEQLQGSRKIIVTTEKDAMRLLSNPYYPQSLKPLTFMLPIEVRMLPGPSGSDLIEAVEKAINEKENPLNAIYDA